MMTTTPDLTSVATDWDLGRPSGLWPQTGTALSLWSGEVSRPAQSRALGQAQEQYLASTSRLKPKQKCRPFILIKVFGKYIYCTCVFIFLFLAVVLLLVLAVVLLLGLQPCREV